MTIEGDEGLWVTSLVAYYLLGSLNLVLEDFLCFGHMENCQILQELDVTLLMQFTTQQKPASVFGRGTLLKDGPNGLCHTSSGTPSEQRRELILDLAWLSPNPNQVSPAIFILVFSRGCQTHRSIEVKELRQQMMRNSRGDEDTPRTKGKGITILSWKNGLQDRTPCVLSSS